MSAGKIHKLKELLPPMQKKGDRILIFSQFVQVLNILEVVLDTMDIKYLKLTGQTQVADRQGLVDAYNQNEDITVFRSFSFPFSLPPLPPTDLIPFPVLSTRAGGLGLNLTAANTVIFYDCDYKCVFPSLSVPSQRY
jgi:SWI/SNF-related matrix-associated actin-dependent regulator 1 of chromatin subfamily A